MAEMAKLWEPWLPKVGQRVRVRLSLECRTRCFEGTPPPTVDDDQLRAMMRAGVDVANHFATDNWLDSHPQAIDGATGEITDIYVHDDRVGHYYRVMFDQTVESGAFIGADLAAIELESFGG